MTYGTDEGIGKKNVITKSCTNGIICFFPCRIRFCMDFLFKRSAHSAGPGWEGWKAGGLGGKVARWFKRFSDWEIIRDLVTRNTVSFRKLVAVSRVV